MTKEEPCLIVVQSVDRLWRSEAVMSKAKERIKNTNADVVSIMQPLYSIYKKTDVIDHYNLTVDYSAEESRKEINTKFAKARRVKAQLGNKPCGVAPYGYRWNGNKIEIDYNNHLIVKDIFNMCLECKGNLSEISRRCIGKGYKTTRGNDFSVQAIKNILRNDFYIGVVTHAGEKIDGEHEPIITNLIFNKANEILKR